MKKRHITVEESDFRYKADVIHGNVNRFQARIDIIGNDTKTLGKAINTLLRIKHQMEDDD